MRLAVVLIGACLAAPLHATDALTADAVREDAQLAIDAVEAGLPDIHWHQSPDDWSQAKARALAQLQQVHDTRGLHATLAVLLGQIGEGHLAVLPSADMIAREREQANVLPLDLHWSEDGIFVIAGHGDAADIPAGARLLAINGDDATMLLDELVSISPHDGHIRTGPMRDQGGARYAVLRHRLRGDESVFSVRFQVQGALPAERIVHAQPLSQRPVSPKPERRIATLEWLAPGLAYLEVPSFSNRPYREAHTTFRDAMQRVFDELERGAATRLILDLRQNGGGSEPNESILYAFLAGAPLHKYEAVEARGRTVSVTDLSGRVYDTEVFDEDEINFQRERPDGRLTRRNVAPEGLMTHWVPSPPVYEGKLVVLISGYTFSGGAELTSMLRHTDRGVFVGEESGGTHEGNTSGYSWELTLPNSGIQLHIPLLQFRFNWPGLPKSRGVQPDCAVPPLVEEIGHTRDRAWHVARAIALQDWTTPSAAICPPLSDTALR